MASGSPWGCRKDFSIEINSLMKHNHNHDNALEPAARLVPVRFEFTDLKATTVCVAGTFNNWKPEAKALHPDGTGKWWKETPLKPGDYEYCFVVDGQWIADPRAAESVANPFGGRNSILKVTGAPEATKTDDSKSKTTNKRQ
jgi:1,4-alpha-glucan branching enzyme